MPDFNAKMHQNRFRLGLRPRPRWGSLQRSPEPLAGFKGPILREGTGGKGCSTCLLLRFDNPGYGPDTFKKKILKSALLKFGEVMGKSTHGVHIGLRAPHGACSSNVVVQGIILSRPLPFNRGRTISIR